MAKMSRQELAELIQSIEEGGGDATDLKALLAEVDSDERTSAGRKTNVSSSPGGLRATRDEEMTTQEYLEQKVGDLFDEGITSEVLEMLFEMDRDHRLPELKKMCVEAGLSSSGDKKVLAAKLLAYQRRTEMEHKPELVPDNQVEADNQVEMSNEWEADPGEVLVIPQIYFDPIQYEAVVFGRFDFAIQCVKYYPTERGTWTFDGALMDTSTHDSLGNITKQKMSYYPAMSLTNAAFIIIPKPKPLDNPEEYRKRLQFKVVVIGKREWTFRCADYKWTEEGMWEFGGVLRDTSGRVPKNDVTLKLVNAAFMVLPAPEGEED